MARIFISYATPDRVFALQLATSIKQLGHAVWMDVAEIGVGDSLVRGINAGLSQAEYLIAVLSPHALQSAWVSHEWEVKSTEEIVQRRTMVLPVLIADCPIPLSLRHKQFVDFRQGYEVGFAHLAITLHQHKQGQAVEKTDQDTSHLLLPATLSPHDNTKLHWYTADMVNVPSKFAEINVELGIPYIGKISGVWKPNEDEQFAAWELYIELVTRVPVAQLHDEEGSLREALTSLYTVFGITRDILHKYGPAIARPKHGGAVSFGLLAISVLNNAIRPILAYWHPALLEYEQIRVSGISALEHERRWEKAGELRQALHETRTVMVNYAQLLAQVAGIPPMNP